MNRQKRIIGIVLLLLFLLIVPPFWITYREYRQAKLNHALIEAIKAGNDQKALEVLAEGASGEARDTGEPPTFKAAFVHLLDHFRHPGQKKDKGEHLPALLLLYRSGFQKAVESKPDMDVEQRESDRNLGPGPDQDLVRALLNHGASVKDQDVNNKTPLWYAANFSNADIVKHLLARGANVDAANTDGNTPLIMAIPRNEPIASVLLDYGANPNAMGTESEWNTTQRMSALARAIWFHKPALVPKLLAKGANPNVPEGGWGYTPLVWADPKTARLLIAHGANVNAIDNNGETVLMVAVDFDDIELVQVLLQNGANASAKDDLGLSVRERPGYFTRSWHKNTPKIIALLRKYGEK